ncbi:MAG: ATP-binding protein [Thiobacillaceae bacterium]|nr:ATP-binding protein [Thiobacillaceae bacterium]MDW8322875.1 ATP-binding protein [Burkholderiales bacterium]
MTAALDAFLARAQALLDRLEPLLPPASPALDWRQTLAARWRRGGFGGWLEPVPAPDCPPWSALRRIEAQKQALERNTRQFVAGLPANHALLAGSRGCGKSSLVRALLARHARQGLRMVEVDKVDLIDLPHLIARLPRAPWRFILFADDLSFDAHEPAYKALKAALDGSLAGLPDNVLIYATSNRRHLMPEFFAENAETRHLGGEVRPGEGIEEKLSLADRFGLVLTFYPFDQDDYLDIVAAWVRALGGRVSADMRAAALQWAIARGGRSGRVARQFAADWVGQQRLGVR